MGKKGTKIVQHYIWKWRKKGPQEDQDEDGNIRSGRLFSKEGIIGKELQRRKCGSCLLARNIPVTHRSWGTRVPYSHTETRHTCDRNIQLIHAMAYVLTAVPYIVLHHKHNRHITTLQFSLWQSHFIYVNIT